jgi:hypothetical protein
LQSSCSNENSQPSIENTFSRIASFSSNLIDSNRSIISSPSFINSNKPNSLDGFSIDSQTSSSSTFIETSLADEINTVKSNSNVASNGLNKDSTESETSARRASLNNSEAASNSKVSTLVKTETKKNYSREAFLPNILSFENRVTCAKGFIFEKSCLEIDKRRDWKVKQLANLLIDKINTEKNWTLIWHHQSTGYFSHFYECSIGDCDFMIKVEIDEKLNHAFCKASKSEHNCVAF